MPGRLDARPVRKQDPDIDERIPERAHLPVEHCHQTRQVRGVEHDVVELEVAVNDRRPVRLRRQTCEQPLRQRFHLWKLVDLRFVPAFGPPAHLPFHETGWFTVCRQA